MGPATAAGGDSADSESERGYFTVTQLELYQGRVPLAGCVCESTSSGTGAARTPGRPDRRLGLQVRLRPSAPTTRVERTYRRRWPPAGSLAGTARSLAARVAGAPPWPPAPVRHWQFPSPIQVLLPMPLALLRLLPAPRPCRCQWQLKLSRSPHLTSTIWHAALRHSSALASLAPTGKSSLRGSLQCREALPTRRVVSVQVTHRQPD